MGERPRNGLRWKAALERAIQKMDEGKSAAAQSILVDIWTNALKQAQAGDLGFLKEIGDRLDGRAHQAISVAGEDGQPLIQTITVKIVRPDDPDTGKA